VVLKKRVMDEEAKRELERILGDLETEFNLLSDQQPVVMDVLLETLE